MMARVPASASCAGSGTPDAARGSGDQCGFVGIVSHSSCFSYLRVSSKRELSSWSRNWPGIEKYLQGRSGGRQFIGHVTLLLQIPLNGGSPERLLSNFPRAPPASGPP